MLSALAVYFDLDKLDKPNKENNPAERNVISDKEHHDEKANERRESTKNVGKIDSKNEEHNRLQGFSGRLALQSEMLLRAH